MRDFIYPIAISSHKICHSELYLLLENEGIQEAAIRGAGPTPGLDKRHCEATEGPGQGDQQRVG